jgi:hypothetical protein
MRFKKQIFRIKQQIKKALVAGNKFITKYIEDILIVSGLIVIVKATFLLSKLAGLYCLGGILLVLGVIVSIKPPKGR